MNAENGKLTAANVAQRSTPLRNRTSPVADGKCHHALPLPSAVAQQSPCRRSRSPARSPRSKRAPGPNLRRCRNPSVTLERSWRGGEGGGPWCIYPV